MSKQYTIRERSDALYDLLSDIESALRCAREDCAFEDVDDILGALEDAEYNARKVRDRLDEEIRSDDDAHLAWMDRQYERDAI